MYLAQCNFSRFLSFRSIQKVTSFAKLNCVISDQSKQATTSKKSWWIWPAKVSSMFHWYQRYINCFEEVQRKRAFYKFGQGIGLLFAKCRTKQTESESAELFSTLQIVVGVKGGAEIIIPVVKIRFEKLQHSQNAAILHIEF